MKPANRVLKSFTQIVKPVVLFLFLGNLSACSVSITHGVTVHTSTSSMNQPPQVPILSASGSAGRIRLSWPAPAGPSITYQVKRTIQYDAEFATIAENVSGSSYDDTSVIDGVMYTYQVLACTPATGCFLESNTVQAVASSLNVTTLGMQMPYALSQTSAVTGPIISGDGRYVLVLSRATDLQTSGTSTNGRQNLFVIDRNTGVIENVSVSTSGVESNGDSDYNATISGDGRFVAFSSSGATNLDETPGYIDNNGTTDVFLRDRLLGTTTCISKAVDGTAGNGSSGAVAISADGRYVTYHSLATNLVTAPDTNGGFDVFLYDRISRTTTRISQTIDGTQGNQHSHTPSISADGSRIAFTSWSTNFVSDDTNGFWDTFVYNRINGSIKRFNLGTNGVQGNGHSWNPEISHDGRYVVFLTTATNLFDGDLRTEQDLVWQDLETGINKRVTIGNDGLEPAGSGSYTQDYSISADGSLVLYQSAYSNLDTVTDTNGALDAFIYDARTGRNTLISKTTAGIPGTTHAATYSGAISANGKHFVFETASSDFVVGDNDGAPDTFVYSRP